ncbi:hypothetical protein IM792_00675 [Mucilaginibacter sp. JRF]|uniref:hypothetical protein n=1 Tax=Mucilaginibacter sp. JRF TaxID=2780088 RepID=UPI00188103D6|nr:hypothetical protein [Mucilaginibacter sp. JRF]MBE9582950.1 hypothetical protein [Mucilaginibacter sp. JRF]
MKFSASKFATTFLLLIISFSTLAQKRPSTKPFHDVVAQHRQIFDNSCIPMSIELVLKYHNKVSPDFYDLQKQWQNKLDGTFSNFDGKTIRGLKFKRQFDMPRGDSFPFNKLFSTIDNELKAGRKVIVSLPSGGGMWHMYVIDRKIEGGDYLAYSRANNMNTHLTLEYIKRWIFGVKGTDIMTYSIVN